MISDGYPLEWRSGSGGDSFVEWRLFVGDDSGVDFVVVVVCFEVVMEVAVVEGWNEVVGCWAAVRWSR